MIHSEYFYRKLFSAEFIKSASEKKVIPVRPKNLCNQRNFYFDAEKKEWLCACENPEDEGEFIFSEENLGGIPVEFVETPLEPEYSSELPNDMYSIDYLTGKIIIPPLEQMNVQQIKIFLDFRKLKNEYIFNLNNFRDSDNVEKDYFAARITEDTEELTLKITFYKFVRCKNEKTQIPTITEQSLFFDLKNGDVDILSDACFSSIENEDDFSMHASEYSSIFKKNGNFYGKPHSYEKGKELPAKKLSVEELYCKNIEVCTNYENDCLPKKILQIAYRKLLDLAEAFTKISFDRFRGKITPYSKFLLKMYKITMLPYEPELYPVILNREVRERKIFFLYKRTDSKIFKHFCRSYKIKNTKILRKSFAERPEVLIIFLRLKDGGFKDINLYNRVITDTDKSSLISSVDPASLSFFCKWSIKKCGQKKTMNLLFKESDDSSYLEDSLDMFCKYFKHIEGHLKEDILKDGFTKFNHDALSNLSWQYEHKNIRFSYTDEQKKLQDEIDGYKFCLPEDSYKLCEIGTALHNCVASYANKVKEKKCIIVYAIKDGEYKICIEVCQNKIIQERADRNGNPTPEECKIMDKWHDRHNLVLCV